MARFWLAALLLLVGSVLARGQNPEPVARCQAVQGVLLAKGTVKPGDAVAAGAPLIALFQAELQSQNQAVDLKLIGDIGQHGLLPVMDTAVVLGKDQKTDLDVTLERGIIVLTNAKKEGAARVRLHLRETALDLTLQQPGTRIGVELYGRHAPGLAHIKADNPTAFLMFLVIHGEVLLAHEDQKVALKAPPGPALLKWDSIFKHPEIEYLEKIPEELQRDEKEKKLFNQMCGFAQSLQDKKPAEHLAAMVKSQDVLERQVAVTAMGALDDLTGLSAALNDPQADVRRQAILVLRHWLGRQPGQIQKLLKVAAETRNISPIQAQTRLQLLLGFDAQERAAPQTYELLIEFLDHGQLPVRELAHWHLVRLAPAGKSIPYDAAAPEDQRRQAVERWRQLIPAGKLPETNNP